MFYHTFVDLDTEGNLRRVTDARGNVVMSYKYDMLGNMVYQDSMDAGKRWLLTNILGNPLRTWDERNHMFEYFYDVLHRPTHSKVLGGDGTSPLDHVFERMFYGEGEANPKQKNVRGQVIRHYDTGGLLESPAYDFKGQPISTHRRLFKKYKEVANWTDANLAQDLEAEVFTFSTKTDALGRISEQIAPDDSVIYPTYNKAGTLKSEKVAHAAIGSNPVMTKTYIKDIDYNEKGQRTKILYGNDVQTTYHYNSQNFRLIQLQSKKGTRLLQDLYYTYDAVGNINEIEDKSHSTVFYDNQQVDPSSSYTYDALYRLTEASGRENKVTPTFGTEDNWKDAGFTKPNSPIALRNYSQTYSYDEVGNIAQMKHLATNASWTRDYAYKTDNNRLKNTKVGTDTYTYPHHAKHGYIESMPHLEKMDWNFKEELVKTIRQKRNNGTPETTYYQYDGSGQRIRKITENQATAGNPTTKKEERIYIAGFEVYKKHSGTDQGLERTSLSLMDGDHRFVMVERRNDIDDGTEASLIRYQMHNHLGSCALELDELAHIVSYEEYHPYGTTAYQAISKSIKASSKRYRYTGMERDEESGLNYHSARYYLPWLGRWLSGDPIGIESGVNLYAYVSDNPIIFLDSSGTSTEYVIGVEVTVEGNFIENALEWIVNAANTAWEWTKEAANTAWEWTKEAANWLMTWIIAPLVRTTTNALAGFLIGGPIGSILGAVTGAIHGWSMAKADSYDWGSPSSWLAFSLDNTWSLPSSALASIMSTIEFIRGNTIDNKSKHSNALMYTDGWANGFATTFGNTMVGMGGQAPNLVKHEQAHVLQSRIFGIFYLPLVGISFTINTFLPYWLLYHDYAGHPINSFGDYFMKGVYPHTWHEEWGYSVGGTPP